MITTIIKRDGREANFDTEKITQAIYKAAQAIGGNDYDAAKALSLQVADLLEKKCGDKAPRKNSQGIYPLSCRAYKSS